MLFGWALYIAMGAAHVEAGPFFFLGVVAAGMVVMVVYALLDVGIELRQLRQDTLALSEPRVRDYYAVQVVIVSMDGRELVKGNKSDGYYVMHPAMKLQKTFHDDNLTWLKRDEQEHATEENIVFEDYAAATKYAEGAAKRDAYPDLAREVSLWVVSGPDKERARRGVGNTYKLQWWPTKVWEAELASG